MEKRIKQEINRVEEKYGIEVLWACETGSRAWGFPSPDSDYDVRLIYKHKLNWYLTLSEQKDSLDYMSDDKEIDMTGWDIRKCLRLLQKSNAPLLERIQSDIIYTQKDGFISGFISQAELCYSPISTLFHYLKLGEKSYSEIEGEEEFKLKKFFYSLRGAMACKWIFQKEIMPPISFVRMVDGLELPTSIKKRIFDLIEVKSTKSESYLHKGEQELKDFICETLDKARAEASTVGTTKVRESDLNDYFRKVIRAK